MAFLFERKERRKMVEEKGEESGEIEELDR